MISYFIENRFGERLTFSETNNPRRDPISFTPDKQLFGKQNQFGVISRGSFKEASKKLVIKFDIAVESPEQYYYELNRIAAFLYNPFFRPFYVYSIERAVRAKVSIGKLIENFNPGLETKIAIGNSLELDMEDALWESGTSTPISKILANGQTLEVFLRDDFVETAPLISIMNPNAAIIPEFAISMENRDFAANFVIANNDFAQNKTITVDCASGNVKLGDSFINPSLIAGNVFSLFSGKNIIRYEAPLGLAVKLSCEYRSRVIF